MVDWVRLWHDMPTDPKWRVIARKSGQPLSAVVALFTLMMTTASAAADRGNVEGLTAEDAAAALDLEEDQVAAIWAAMEGRVVEDNRLTGWERRQPKREDNSGHRVQEFRERGRKRHEEEQKRTVTQCNAPDTDTDTEEDISELRSLGRSAKPTRPQARADDFQKFWTEYPKREGSNPKEPARKKFVAAVKSGAEPEAIIRGVVAYADEQKQLGKIGTTYVAQAVTWLNQQRWNDYAPNTNGTSHTGPPEHLTGAERAAWVRQRVEEQLNGGNESKGASVLGQGNPVRSQCCDRPEKSALGRGQGRQSTLGMGGLFPAVSGLEAGNAVQVRGPDD